MSLTGEMRIILATGEIVSSTFTVSETSYMNLLFRLSAKNPIS